MIIQNKKHFKIKSLHNKPYTEYSKQCNRGLTQADAAVLQQVAQMVKHRTLVLSADTAEVTQETTAAGHHLGESNLLGKKKNKHFSQMHNVWCVLCYKLQAWKVKDLKKSQLPSNLLLHLTRWPSLPSQSHAYPELSSDWGVGRTPCYSWYFWKKKPEAIHRCYIT